ncbi:hypothetical protein [Mycobacteroides abscessus]|uniref:hypothetical protein n=1 Tax=Mycobacteroides abscessus TaxID=36809 RepID=UPI000C266A8A|nr:hypothetical protein [Mycobacteroides abscessus]
MLSCRSFHASIAAALASGDKPCTALSGAAAFTSAAGTNVAPTFPVGAAAAPSDDVPAVAVDDDPTGVTAAVAPAAAGAPIPGDGNNGNEPPGVPAAVAGVTIP